MGCAQSALVVADERGFKFDALLPVARAPDPGINEVAVAKVDNQLAIERHIVETFDERTRFGEVADQDRTLVIAKITRTLRNIEMRSLRCLLGPDGGIVQSPASNRSSSSSVVIALL